MLSDSESSPHPLAAPLARPHKIVFSDHRRRAKRRCLNIANHRGKRRLRAYRDLLNSQDLITPRGRCGKRIGSPTCSLVIVGQLRHYLI